MENRLRMRGEGRLKSMMSIPVERLDTCLGKTVVVFNIDSAVENSFPPEISEDPAVRERIEEIVKLVQRVNNIAASSAR